MPDLQGCSTFVNNATKSYQTHWITFLSPKRSLHKFTGYFKLSKECQTELDQRVSGASFAIPICLPGSDDPFESGGDVETFHIAQIA
jgi:hypothetical protein